MPHSLPLKHPLHIAVLAAFLLPCYLGAQVTVTNAYFPVAGDTLFTATDLLPQNITVSAPGPDQDWDYRSLRAPFVIERLILAPEEGKGGEGFPDADHFFIANTSIETYYRSTPTTYDLLGAYGEDPEDLGLDTAIRLDQPFTQRWAPLQYEDAHRTESAVNLVISVDELPEEIVSQIPFPIDSIRLRGVISRYDTVDAWGTLHLPEGSYDVLRERRSLESDLRVGAKLNPFNWQDVTDLIIDALPENDFLGPINTEEYFFWSNDYKEALAEVRMDPTESFPVQVNFRATDLTTPTRRIARGKPDVYAYPNPAISDVRFAFSDLPAGEYTLRLFNILGVEQWQRRFFIDGQRTEQVSIANLSKGSYLYSLANAEGRTLITKRLIVIRP